MVRIGKGSGACLGPVRVQIQPKMQALITSTPGTNPQSHIREPGRKENQFCIQHHQLSPLSPLAQVVEGIILYCITDLQLMFCVNHPMKRNRIGPSTLFSFIKIQEEKMQILKGKNMEAMTNFNA